MMALMLAAAATAAVSSAPLPQGFVPLSAAPDRDVPQRLCSPDRRWCVVPPEPEDGTLYVDKGTTGESYWAPPEGDGSSYTFVPAIAPLKAGGALLLMKARRIVGYSGGGGGEFISWVLLNVAPKGTVTRVLTAPASSSVLIRACFSDKDMKQRAGACHDELKMSGTIALKDDGSAMPPVQYRMAARSFPRGLKHGVDSLSLPPLHKADLVWETDATCTYDRIFVYQPGNGQYVPASPLPDCGDYQANR